MTRRKDELAKAGKKKQEEARVAAAPDESACGPASKIIDLKGMSAEDALKLALATPWPPEKRKAAGPDMDTEPAGKG